MKEIISTERFFLNKADVKGIDGMCFTRGLYERHTFIDGSIVWTRPHDNGSWVNPQNINVLNAAVE